MSVSTEEIIYEYTDALEACKEYFNGNELSASVFLDKYALRNKNGDLLEKTPDQMHRRIAKEFARIEKKKFKKPYTEEYIYNCIKNFEKIIPQGSPMFGIGNEYQLVSFGNCFVIDSPSDSYSGILKADEEIVQLSKRRGGVGVDVSNIRPNGTSTSNASKTSTGTIPFCGRFSNTLREVGQCIAGDQQVLSKKGLIQIENIKIGDYVWTKKGWNKVINKISSGKKNVFKIKTKLGYEITASKDHKFQTIEDENIKIKILDDFKTGDNIILIPGNGNHSVEYQKLNTDISYDYNRFDNKSNRLVEYKLPDTLNEELSYILGYSYGDGSVELDKFNEELCLDFACPNNWNEIKEKIKKFSKSSLGIAVNERSGDGDLVRVSINSKLIMKFFKGNNICKEKSYDIIFPEIIKASPISVQMAFISGYFDADGYASGKKKGYCFNSISRGFLREIQKILFSVGICSKIYLEERQEKTNKRWKDLYSLCIVGGSSQKKSIKYLYFSTKIMEKNFVSKKDCFMTPYKAKTFGIQYNKYPYCPDNSQYLSLSCFEKIKEEENINQESLISDIVIAIDEAGEKETYDLTVENEHWFYCEGFYVKNSGRRGAGMISMDIHHPESVIPWDDKEDGEPDFVLVDHPDYGKYEISRRYYNPEKIDFATCKYDPQKVTGANISLRISDEFFDALENGKDYEQRWPVDSDNPQIIKKVSAEAVWDKIIHSAWRTAEPGVLFWQNIIRESPADCYSDLGFKTLSTNPSLRGETLVLTEEGVFPIKWLSENKPQTKVMNYREEWHPCNVFKSGENKRLVKITFSNKQYVYCTEEHKWPILNTAGRMVNKNTGKVIKKKSVDLKNKDKIYFPRITAPINNSDCKFSKEDGFILGWNQGAGWITSHKAYNNAKQFGFIFSEEDLRSGICDRVIDFTNNLAKKPSKLGQDPDTKSYSYCTIDENVSGYLESIGSTYKENGVPETVWQGNDDFIKGYVDGIFSSYGHVEYKEKLSLCKITLVSYYKKLVEDIQKLLCFYGIRSNIKYYFTQNKYHRYELNITGIDTKFFSEKFSLSNINKNEKLKKIHILDNKSNNTKSERKEYNNIRNYLSVSRVEITDIYEDVYDITVHDDTHTFVMESGVTGNCGELPLAKYDACRLLLINVLSFVKNPFTKEAYFDYNEFYNYSKVAQRLMEDLVDLEEEAINKIIKKIKDDPEDEFVKSRELKLWENILEKCSVGRRTGTGVTAIGDAIAALNIDYGSKEGVATVGKIYKTLKFGCYRSSVDMAKELGPFSIWNQDLEKDNSFLNRIKEEEIILECGPLSEGVCYERISGKSIYEDMQEHGRRNIALLTTAPAGSVSLLAKRFLYYGTSSGIEPQYNINPYVRKKKINPGDKNSRTDSIDQNGDHWMHFDVYPICVQEWSEMTGSDDLSQNPWSGNCAYDLDWKKRVMLQAEAQKHIDNSISSTVNLPEDVTVEQVKEIYETAYRAGCKGVTVYRDKCRTGVLVSKNDGPVDQINRTQAPKRPAELPHVLHHATLKGIRYYVSVGMMDGEPYEVFTGMNHDNEGDPIIPKSITEGTVVKVKRGKYVLKAMYNGKESEFSLTNGHSDHNVDALTRMISWGLRHGGGIDFAVHQLEKTKGDMTSFSKVLARTLKKYIQDGTQIHGEHCPQCEETNTLQRQEGCISCKKCGWTKCS